MDRCNLFVIYMLNYKFHEALKPMWIQSLTLFDCTKTVQNIDLYMLRSIKVALSFNTKELSLLVLSRGADCLNVCIVHN